MTKRIAAGLVSCFAAVALLAGPASAAPKSRSTDSVKGQCANNAAAHTTNSPIFCL